MTDSNSRFLSKDIITEFRGRGDEMYLRPLSFVEYKSTWLRNARLNFRQLEETHLMENVMYNELLVVFNIIERGN